MWTGYRDINGCIHLCLFDLGVEEIMGLFLMKFPGFLGQLCLKYCRIPGQMNSEALSACITLWNSRKWKMMANKGRWYLYHIFITHNVLRKVLEKMCWICSYVWYLESVGWPTSPREPSIHEVWAFLVVCKLSTRGTGIFLTCLDESSWFKFILCYKYLSYEFLII